MNSLFVITFIHQQLSILTIAGIFQKNLSFQLIPIAVIILLLLIISAIVSGSEIAFFSLAPGELNQIRNQKDQRNLLTLRLLEKPKRLLATILIVNNFVNVGIVILSTYLTVNIFNLQEFPLLSFVIQVILITSIILLFGEIMPKIYSGHSPTRIVSTFSPFIALLIRIFYPFSTLLVKSTQIIDRRASRRGINLTISELSDVIDITQTENSSEEETNILKGIVKFGNIEVKEIMRSRLDVIALEKETGFPELMSMILEAGYSRMPVYEETFDKVIGILYIKDLLPHFDKDDNFNWLQLIRPAFFVPETKKIDDLLREFQAKKIHLAVVVDEYGGTSGIVTLEDILEEIVGDISDEFDVESDDKLYSKIDENTYVFEAKISLNDFCKVFKIEHRKFEELKGDSDTLAGLILEVYGRIPKKSDVITIRDFEFRIESADDRRIRKIKAHYTGNNSENQKK